MSVQTTTPARHKASGAKVVLLEIRARTNAPDMWLDLPGKDLHRRLVTTGSQCRSTVFDVLGRKSTKGLTRDWAKAERWKEFDDTWTKRPRNRLRHLDDLLDPLIARERLEVQVKSTSGQWISLTRAAANPLLVI
jgi:hypothetical protein